MSLPNPILDDRSYQQLRDELVRRIPVYTPEWTDHNAADPGVTLIELFAFLGENMLYRFNQIPEATKLAFLKLLQIPLRPASAARAMVTLLTAEPKGSLVPAGSEAKAGSLPFETQVEVQVWPVSVVAIGRVQTNAPDPSKEPEAHEFAVRALDAVGGLKEGEQAVYYENRTVPPKGDGTPVDFDATVDGMLWVAVLGEPGSDIDEMGAALLNVGFVPDLIVPAMAEVDACPGVGGEAAGPAVEWQISTGKFSGGGSPLYKKVALEGDTTRGLSRQGVCRLRLPADHKDVGPFVVKDPDQLGTGDLPPSLDEDTSKKILFWLRAFRHDKSRLGKVLLVEANAGEVVQTKTASPEFLGTGNAQPNQAYKLVHRPVVEGSLVLEVEEVGGWRRWEAVGGFHADVADDRHFVLDHEAGEVLFGNGLQGLPPQIGQRIRAVKYKYGGGKDGNVAPEAISKLPAHAAVEVVNPLRAWGGGPKESIEEALDRIPGELRRRDRAVTASDFEELALTTPGANVGRAETLALFHPPSRNASAAGVVSVVIWPREDPAHPAAPRPDRNLLRSVCRRLDQRRLVTTELYVIPPTYRKVAVSVGLQAKPGYGIEEVRRWVELVIRQYLAPLPPFGPSGQGWPLGRRVHGPELEAAALQVEGVEFLEDLRVAGWDEESRSWIQDTVEPVELEAFEVPELTEITVVAGPDVLEPGQSVGQPPSPNVPVPFPVIRQRC